MNSYLPIQPQYIAGASELESTVESDPLALMSANRLELSKLKILLLSSQIGNRRYVHENSLDSIEQDELACLNEMHNRQALHDYEGVQQIQFDQMLRLSRERREEQVSYFRDTSRIGKDLIEAVLEYKSLSNRGEILNQL